MNLGIHPDLHFCGTDMRVELVESLVVHLLSLLISNTSPRS